MHLVAGMTSPDDINSRDARCPPLRWQLAEWRLISLLQKNAWARPLTRQQGRSGLGAGRWALATALLALQGCGQGPVKATCRACGTSLRFQSCRARAAVPLAVFGTAK